MSRLVEFLEDRRRRLEWVIIVAAGSTALGCGAEEGLGDESMPATLGATSGAQEVGGDETETGEPPDPDLCFVVTDAVGVGTCNDVLGYRWETGGCEPIYGCGCEGDGCESLYVDIVQCGADYQHCNLCDPCPDDRSCALYCDGTGLTTQINCQETWTCSDPHTLGSCDTRDIVQEVDADIQCAGPGRVVFARRGEPPRSFERAERSASVAARAWARIAACEAASVESFEQLALTLEQLAAPVHLIDEARRFAADERRHAAIAEALAASLTEPSSSGSASDELPPIEHPRSSLTLAQLLEHTILAGCVGETLAALELEHMVARCRDPILAARMGAIARDEARHAEHAWELLVWLLGRAPELRPLAVAVFARRCDTIDLGLAESLPDHGLLSDEVRAELWALGRRRVVDPLAAALLGDPPGRARVAA